MQESEVKLLFETGDLKEALITSYPMKEGWCLQFNRKRGNAVALDAQRVSPRLFKTLDSAFSVAKRVGFREVKVVE